MAAARQSRPVRPAAAPARPVATTAPPVPQAVVPAGAAPAPVPRRMPGPRLYRIIRAVLVILTLAASAACVGSLVISQANQQAAAASTAHAQDLRDLRVEAAAAQSAALASFTSTGVWSEYGDAAAEVDVDLLAAAASAPQSSDLGELARTIREWHNAIVIAHQTADNPPLTTVTQAYHTVSMTLDAISTTEQSRSSTFNTVSIVAAAFAVAGFLAAAVITARRSRRVVNAGLTTGLLAVIGIVAMAGVYASQVSRISTADSSFARLTQAEANVWDARSQVALAVLDPGQSPSPLGEAGSLLTTATSALGGDGVATDLANLSTALTNGTLTVGSDLWQTTIAGLDSAGHNRPDPAGLVVSATPAVIIVSGLGVVAAIAALAGIHARTKEYA